MSERRPLVGVKLKSGLGNQMHQYAAGLALAERLDAELACDTSYYLRGRLDRPLGLRAFGLRWRACRVPPFRGPSRVLRALHLVSDPFEDAPMLDNRADFDAGFLSLQAPCALRGFFHSWRYFEGHEGAVRKAFNIDMLATPRIAALEAKIRAAPNPVAVHVRRGDYLRSPAAIDYFGPLGADYYRDARRALERRTGGTSYFLFTDDPPGALPVLADWKDLQPVTGFTALEELRLMALCRHFIIANSTYSWWGAWLGRAADKIVVAPRTWFGPAHPPTNIDDRLLPDWIRV